MLEFVKGDMFDAPADIRVNTVNCVGVMGAGVALAFKQRYPDMFKDYQRDCKDGRVQPGTMHVWKSLAGDWIINFPTKRDWREPSRYEDIDAGLDDLRGYLDGIGPVTIALPALGCGHGGLDWGRVSQMISAKLDGVDAHVLVFEPAASRQAGRTASQRPSEDERTSAERLGYELVENDRVPALEAPGPLYVLGPGEALSRSWIALLPSRTPADRELEALRAIATELSRADSRKSVALVHGTRASENVAGIFASEGVDVVLLLPFGVLTRKALAKQASRVGGGVLTLASAAPPNTKWSRQLFAQTMDMLRHNAEAVLLSDPEPEWLTSKGLVKWGTKPTAFVRYGQTPAAMRDALAGAGARPVGRRGENGAPNIDFLIGNEHVTTTAGTDDATGTSGTHGNGSEIEGRVQAVAGNGVLARRFDSEAQDEFGPALEALKAIPMGEIVISVRLPPNASDEDRQSLIALGFEHPQSG